MKKNITFLMPSVQLMPSGGYKIVYEYSNRLVSDGYSVNIIMPAWIDFRSCNLKYKLKGLYNYLRYHLMEKPNVNWFDLDKKIHLLVVPNLNEKYIPQSDIIICTGASTAIPLSQYLKIDKNNKYYFIQGYETWAVGYEKLVESYKLDLNKIVIADWLKEKVEEVGETAQIAYNGFDFNYFNLSTHIEMRNKYNIVMPYNKVKLKGCDIGFEALEIVHAKYPQIRVKLYGVHKPKHIPEYCEFYYKPPKEIHNAIYNDSSIFLGPSFSEGFCLTVAEAMQCGCAPVCTNIGGYMVTCKDGKTALLGQVGDPESLANKMIELIENDELRYRIAKNANIFIKQFTWESAYDTFKKILLLQ